MRRWQGLCPMEGPGVALIVVRAAYHHQGSSSSSSISSRGAVGGMVPPKQATSSAVNARHRSHGSHVIPVKRDWGWTPGSDYYFSAEEEERFFTPFEAPQHARWRTGVGRGDSKATQQPSPSASDTPSAEAEDTRRLVRIGRGAVSRTVDVSIPPVRKEEMDRWMLEESLLLVGIGSNYQLEVTETVTLLPLDATVTYLGDDMRNIDKAYRSAGMYTASEMAEVFFPCIPTFPVLLRPIAEALPSHIIRTLQKHHGDRWLKAFFFMRYPMLFITHSSRYERTTVQLNPAFWFARQHPSYGKADAAMRKHNMFHNQKWVNTESVTLASGVTVAPLVVAASDAAAEGTSASGPLSSSGADPSAQQPRQPLTAKVFQILLRNLPRVPTPPEYKEKEEEKETKKALSFAEMRSRPYVQKRYEPVKLMDWLDSFSAEDRALVELLHKRALVNLLITYVNVFQLVALTTEGDGIFVKGETLLAAHQQSGAQTRQGGASEPVDGDHDTLSEDDGAAKGAWGYAEDDCSRAAGTGDEAEGRRRQEQFRQAMADDLIDVEGILTNEAAEDDGDELRDAVAEGGDKDPVEDDEGEQGDEESLDEEPYGEDSDDMQRASPAFPSVPPKGSGSLTWSSSVTASSLRNCGAAAQHGAGEGDDEVRIFGLGLEDVYVRRLPPDVAPRSLSDWDATTSPDPELAALAARFLAPPPSIQERNDANNFFTASARRFNSLAPPLRLWRWVAVEHIYHGYTPEQRQHLRREYRGLVNFLRYHGKLFELSNDLRYVIAHDPDGAVAPLSIMERRFDPRERVLLPRSFDDDAVQTAEQIGKKEQALFRRTLVRGNIPRHRRDVLMIDPGNPLFSADVLQEEIANLMPTHPVPVTSLMMRLPPLIRALLPYRMNFKASKYFSVEVQRGEPMLTRKTATEETAAPTAEVVAPMSVEDAVAEVLQLPIGEDGVAFTALRLMHLSVEAEKTLREHYGTLRAALQAFPQYFELMEKSTPRGPLQMVRFRK